MWLVSTFEKTNLKILFFVSTFLDWYKAVGLSRKMSSIMRRKI